MNQEILSVNGVDVPIMIAEAARRLHLQGTATLSIDLADVIDQPSPSDSNAFWTNDARSVTFASLESRNQIVAALVGYEIARDFPTLTGAGIFDVAATLWRDEIGHADKASGHLLALVSGQFNIFDAASQLIESNQKPVFEVLHLLEAALPHLLIFSVDDILCIVRAQHEQTRGDMAAGLLFNAIEKALIAHPSTAWALHERVKSDLEEATANLYCVALMALSNTERPDDAVNVALADAQSETHTLPKLALWTIARMLSSYELNKAVQDQCVRTLLNKCEHAQIEVQQAAISGLARAATKHAHLRRELLTFATLANQYALAVVADHLYMNFETAKSDTCFADLVSALSNLSVETVGGIENFDWVLSELIGLAEHRELAYTCLKAWIVRNAGSRFKDRHSIELFDQTVFALAQMPEFLSEFITRWLVAGERELGSACGGLISMLWVSGFKSPTFAKSLLDTLETGDLKYLARRMLGYVISEEPLLSLTFSLLNTRDAPNRTFGLVKSILCKEVGRDYVKATLDAINENLEVQVEAKSMLAEAHAELSQYVDLLDALPRIQELRPSVRLQRTIQLRRSRKMRESMDAAEEKSIFRQLAKQVPLKAGIGWFAVKDGVIGETSFLQSISHQVSLPRRSTSDPVGYAIAGLGYRIAKRGDE